VWIKTQAGGGNSRSVIGRVLLERGIEPLTYETLTTEKNKSKTFGDLHWSEGNWGDGSDRLLWGGWEK